MPRTTGGTYNLPSGNPVTTGAVISSSWANDTLTDLATEITDSLSRSGSGPMLAPLLVPNGTNSAPSVAFSNETNSGLYRAASNDIRIQVNASHVATFEPDGVTVPVGITVSNTAANGVGLTATGNGTGAGVSATGGSTSANGVTATGGATSGTGVYGAGAAPNGKGASFLGVGTGVGVLGTGGNTSGAGLSGVGGTNGPGLAGAGTGTGPGVIATGGNTNGTGGAFTGGTNGAGVTATGAGTGRGITAVGAVGAHATGTTNQGVIGIGASGWPGGHFENGAAATGGTRRDALAIGNGDLDMSSVVNPDANVGFTNRLTPKNIVKAWGYVSSNGSGAVTLVDGFNVSGVSISGSGVTVTFAADMGDINYCVVATMGSQAIAYVSGKTTEQFLLSSASNFATSSLFAQFIVLGVQ